MKNFILKSVIFSFILSLFLIGTYFAIQARQSSTSGITVDSNNPASLYVGTNETLTAAKRNRLVQSTMREEVDKDNTDPFDNNCERRWQIDDGTVDQIRYANNIHKTGFNIYSSSPNTRYYLNYTTKGTTQIDTPAGTKPTLHIRKKCK